MATRQQGASPGGYPRVTTFIDFRYSRTLAAALFTGEEREEREIQALPAADNYIALEIGSSQASRRLCAWKDAEGNEVLALHHDHGIVTASGPAGDSIPAMPGGGPKSGILAVRIAPFTIGIRRGDKVAETQVDVLGGKPATLECDGETKILGEGTGRAARWAELFYKRKNPTGLCVQMTMDWHNLRAGIPLFGTMTAEELVVAGEYRLRFRSYAYEQSEADTTDFVMMFGCDDPPDVAVHLTPALYDTSVPGIPNLGFAVIETDSVHPYLVERCNRMDRICVPSTFTRETFSRNGVTKPIDVVLHGVDTEYFRPADPKVAFPQGAGFNFLAIATHVERKNIRALVRAFLEEFRSSEDVSLFLLLRPEYHTTQNNVALDFTEWEREYDRDSARILLWTGYVTREHLRDFYANADAYVMPSNEGFGLTVLEAMSCGTPAVVLDHGGVKDFVNEKNGILVKKGPSYVAEDVDTLPYVGDVFHSPDISGLRRAMRRLFEDRDETRRLGRQARADAARLTWSSVTMELARSIGTTHAQFIPGTRPPASDQQMSGLTVVLRVMDDIDARAAIDYLSTLRGVRVLCLFTRYARLEDIKRAREYGFVYYRWDGSDSNAGVIARSVMGEGKVVMLDAGEKLDLGFTENLRERRGTPG